MGPAVERVRKAELEARLANLERHRASLTAVLTQSRGVDSPTIRIQQRHLQRAEVQIARLRLVLRGRPDTLRSR